MKSTKTHNGSISLCVEKAEKRIPGIIKKASKDGIEIESVNIHKPTLEDVFLHYTGRKIRDEGADMKENFRRHMVAGGRR